MKVTSTKCGRFEGLSLTFARGTANWQTPK
jgi:hypothetical protein